MMGMWLLVSIAVVFNLFSLRCSIFFKFILLVAAAAVYYGLIWVQLTVTPETPQEWLWLVDQIIFCHESLSRVLARLLDKEVQLAVTTHCFRCSLRRLCFQALDGITPASAIYWMPQAESLACLQTPKPMPNRASTVTMRCLSVSSSST